MWGKLTEKDGPPSETIQPFKQTALKFYCWANRIKNITRRSRVHGPNRRATSCSCWFYFVHHQKIENVTESNWDSITIKRKRSSSKARFIASNWCWEKTIHKDKLRGRVWVDQQQITRIRVVKRAQTWTTPMIFDISEEQHVYPP